MHFIGNWGLREGGDGRREDVLVRELGRGRNGVYDIHGFG